MKHFELDADGGHGADAYDGRDGGNAFFGGMRGGDGDDAGQATPGVSGGVIALGLGWVQGEVVLHGIVEPAQRASRRAESRMRPEALGLISVSAVGGDGGDGGRGGDGGDGGRGSDGRDATASSSGTNGGRGGDGGDGGHGSSGANGGRGGQIHLRLASADTWLLMAVAGSDTPEGLVRGGAGGKAGQHGRGGRGGWGGSGGSSYSSTDSSGKTTYKSGGWSGPSGSHGKTPKTPLFDGAEGDSGRFTIEVSDPPHKGHYPRRYDLRVRGFVLDETTEGDDRDGIFELGEVVVAEDFDLVNDGGMPSPGHAPAVIQVVAGPWVEPLGDETLLGRSLAIHEHALLSEPLRFRIPRPTITEPGEPLIVRQEVALTVSQRGPSGVGFEGRYRDRHVTRTLEARFPVENRDHVQALRSLAPGETTRFSFTVHNVSRAVLGQRRPVAIQIQLAGGELGPGDIEVFGPTGPIDLTGSQEGKAGLFHRIPELVGDGSYTLEGRIRVREGLAPYFHARLRFTIWLAELGADRAGFFAVQHRDLEVRIEPRFRARPDGRALLCLNERTTRPAYLAWMSLLSDELGLPYDTWSLSREGHFDWRRELEDGTTLKAWLADRVAIVINQPFHARASAETDWPAEYIPAREAREGATHEGTHLLIVGGSDVALSDILRPTAEARLAGDDFDDEEQLLRKEAKTGGSMTQEVMRDDLTLAWDEVALHKTLFWRAPHVSDPHTAALALLTRLEALYPSRRYVIVIHPNIYQPALERRWFFWRRWPLGRAEVRRTLDIDHSSAVLLTADERQLSDPSYIGGPEIRYAVLLSLPFTDKVQRLFSLIGRGRFDTAALCVRAILVDLAEEQTALRRSAVPLSDEVLKERLACLDELGRGDWPVIGDEGQRVLATLIGGIVALAKLELRWWTLWGRNKAISRAMRERAKVLTATWGVEPRLVEDAASLYRARVRHHLGALPRKLAARRYFQHPPDLHWRVTRDIDVWLTPEARIWSDTDLATARLAEAHRREKQARLYVDNARARVDMSAIDHTVATKTVDASLVRDASELTN